MSEPIVPDDAEPIPQRQVAPVIEPAGPVQIITPGQVGTVVFWLVSGSVVILGLWSLMVISDCPHDSISQYAINVANLVLGGFLSTVAYYFGRQHGGPPNGK